MDDYEGNLKTIGDRLVARGNNQANFQLDRDAISSVSADQEEKFEDLTSRLNHFECEFNTITRANQTERGALPAPKSKEITASIPGSQPPELTLESVRLPRPTLIWHVSKAVQAGVRKIKKNRASLQVGQVQHGVRCTCSIHFALRTIPAISNLCGLPWQLLLAKLVLPPDHRLPRAASRLNAASKLGAPPRDARAALSMSNCPLPS